MLYKQVYKQWTAPSACIHFTLVDVRILHREQTVRPPPVAHAVPLLLKPGSFRASNI